MTERSPRVKRYNKAKISTSSDTSMNGDDDLSDDEESHTFISTISDYSTPRIGFRSEFLDRSEHEDVLSHRVTNEKLLPNATMETVDDFTSIPVSDEPLSMWKNIALVIIIAVFIGYLIVYFNYHSMDAPYFDYIEPNLSAQARTKFTNQLQALNLKKNVVRRIRAYTRTYYDIDQLPTSPVCMLIMSNVMFNSQSLASHLCAIVNEGQSVEVINPPLQATANDVTQLLHDQFEQKVVRPVTRCVIINAVDQLPGNSSLSLHAFCDTDQAPRKRLLIAMPVALHDIRDKEEDCDRTVETMLEKSWATQGLTKDKIGALLTRVAINNICVD